MLPSEVSARRSAHVPPEHSEPGVPKVVMLMTRKRRREMGCPVLLVTVRRMSSVPKVAVGAVVKVRPRFGAEEDETDGSSSVNAIVELFTMGLARFSGPGAPSR